jgi:sugar phosphate isomerase/epimerase
MIFVSSSCVKAGKIKDAVLELARNGFRNIELSGGTVYYPGFEDDLLQLKSEYDLNYQIHNYFPPPQEHFVLNLASPDKSIFNKAMDHCKKAIELAERLGIDKYGIHAGFLMDPFVKELGKSIASNKLYNRNEAIDIFCEGYSKLNGHSETVEVYIENNVLSETNFSNFRANPFLLTDHDSWLELKQYIEFPLLLDLAHLKVSCTTLGREFHSDAKKLLSHSDYLHLSDNNGKEDANEKLLENSEILKILQDQDINNKTITMEIYKDLNSIKESESLLKKIITQGE